MDHASRSALALIFFLLSVTASGQSDTSDRRIIEGLAGIDVMAKGARLGVRISPIQDLSLELSFGRDLIMDLFDDPDYRVNIGLGWPIGCNGKLLMNADFSHSIYINYNTEKITSKTNYYTITIGSNTSDDTMMLFYYRAGVTLMLEEDHVGFISDFYPTIDVGILLKIL